jgi:hypothetical protein
MSNGLPPAMHVILIPGVKLDRLVAGRDRPPK